MPISIDHLIHSRRRTVALIIQPDGSLMVRAPLNMSEKNIRDFVQNHAGWIQEKQSRARAITLPEQKHFIAGETFPFLGKDHPLTIVSNQRSAVVFMGGRFHLAKSHLPRAREAFIRWYKAQARAVFSERVAFHAKKHGFKVQKMRISSARTRWGSCSTNGTLSFTWRLVLAPPEIVDYVVLHELVHTRVPNHSRTFWLTLSGISPEYKSRLRWLKQNGRALTF